MKHLTLPKVALLFVALLLGAILANAQTASITYFEVDANAVYSQEPAAFVFDPDSLQQWQDNLPDTATTATIFIVAVNNPSQGDSLLFTLTDELGSVIYNAGNSFASWQTGNAYRIQDNILYLTINAGAYPYLKHFSASATITSGGEHSTKTFKKS